MAHMHVQRTWLTVASGFLVLSSCADRPRPFPDFCAKLGRPLTPTERYSKALLAVYDDPKKVSLRHFANFRDQRLTANPSERPQNVVASYLAQNPKCCALVDPWPVREYYRHINILGKNSTAEKEFRELTKEFRWSHDVLIGANGTAVPSKRIYNIEFQQSDCGDVSQHGRG